MRRSTLADAVLVGHFLFAAFAVFGGLFAFYDRRIMLFHLPAVIWSSVVNLANWTCPLTPLEQRLRRSAGETAFQGGWIVHYFEPLVRPLGMPRRLELVAGMSVLIWNLAVYTAVFWPDLAGEALASCSAYASPGIAGARIDRQGVVPCTPFWGSSAGVCCSCCAGRSPCSR
jgi:hypothetical protein